MDSRFSDFFGPWWHRRLTFHPNLPLPVWSAETEQCRFWYRARACQSMGAISAPSQVVPELRIQSNVRRRIRERPRLGLPIFPFIQESCAAFRF